MDMRRCKTAVIGLGGMGRSHLAMYARQPRTEVVAVCDRLPGRAEAVAGELSVPSFYTDWGHLLEAERPEIVSVVTNGPSHAEITIAAARSGAKAVYCEKPMASRLADARAMIEACRQFETVLAVNHDRRWSRSYENLKRAIASGVIGRPVHLTMTCGGGRLGCTGTHLFDLMRFLFGCDAASVTGALDRTGRPDPRGPEFRDPGGYALIEFEGGRRAFLDLSEDIGTGFDTTLIGDQGRVFISEGSSRWEALTRPSAERAGDFWDWGKPLRPHPLDVPDNQDVRAWMDSALEEILARMSGQEGILRCSGEDGYKALEMMVAIHLSDREGRVPVSLPLTGAIISEEFKVT